jgi:hypothetical protein
MSFLNDYEFSFLIYLLDVVDLFDTSECVVNLLEKCGFTNWPEMIIWLFIIISFTAIGVQHEIEYRNITIL